MMTDPPALHEKFEMESVVVTRGFEPGSRMNGLRGTIVGVASMHVIFVYIILLDSPLNVCGEIFRAVTIPGSHLDKAAV